MSPIEITVIVAYVAVLLVLSVYGSHRYYMAWLYYRHKFRLPTPRCRFDALPRVTVQLPIFNELYVVNRLIEAVCRLEYPLDALEIQVLDDSTDETTKIAREFVAVFDADFVPEPDFLRRTVHFFSDLGVGMVQVRWEHLNRQYSTLTQCQSILLDGHFVIEHTARNRSGAFFNFNGTAGIWRRETICSAGGWQHDTLTEDLDLSYRAQLAGWRFVFLPQVAAPVAVPAGMNAS